MRAVNFIPAERRLRMQARRRLRAWVAMLAAYVLLIGLGCALALAVHATDRARPIVDADALEQEVEQTRRSIASVRRQLTEARARIDALRTITAQVDWSILLAVLAETVGQDVVLSGCRLEPIDASNAIDPPGFVVYLDGEGRSQSAVSQFVLRLERVGLFSNVVLLKTRRDARLWGPDGGGEIVVFSIEARLAPRPAQRPPQDGGRAP